MLRRLVDEARRTGGEKSQDRARQAIAYRFMSAMAGDLPGFEEAARALFAGNRDSFERQIAAWPADLRDYTLKLASGALSTMAVVKGEGKLRPTSSRCLTFAGRIAPQPRTGHNADLNSTGRWRAFCLAVAKEPTKVTANVAG